MNKYLVSTLLVSLVLCGCYHSYRALHPAQAQVRATVQPSTSLVPESVRKLLQRVQKDATKSPYPLPLVTKC